MVKRKVKGTSLAPRAPSIPAPIGLTTLPAGIRKVRQVITPTLNIKVGVENARILVMIDAMRVSTYEDPKRKQAAGKANKPATICTVGDVMTGEELTLLCPSVLESSLKEAYPNDGYVGKCFYMEKLPKRPGKDYFDFKCVEVDASELKAG